MRVAGRASDEENVERRSLMSAITPEGFDPPAKTK